MQELVSIVVMPVLYIVYSDQSEHRISLYNTGHMSNKQEQNTAAVYSTHQKYPHTWYMAVLIGG